MTEAIFATYAPLYWAKGLPAIPLRQGDKMPVIDGWQFYAERMPTLAEQEYWLQAYPTSNVGLVLGPQSGLVMIDIDTDDERLKKAIVDALPHKSPWQRIGSKGMVLAYRQPANGTMLRTFRIRRAGVEKDQAGLVEGLSTRTQVVLPPSIHPKTQKPYVENCSLLDVLDELPHLPSDIETILRGALADTGIELSSSGWTRVTDYVATGARDNQMTRVAGLMAQGVTRGELTLLDAINRMHAWYETCVEKIAGDDIDVRKGVQNMIGFLTRDVMERKKALPQGWDEGVDENLKKQLGLSFTHEHEEWTYEQILNYLRVEFEKHSTGSQGWIETVTYILERLSRSESLDGIAEEAILRYISECSGSKLTLTTLRKRLNEFRQGEIKGQDHTEVARAVIADVSQYGELRYHNEKFWQWNGSHWEKKDRDELLRIVADRFGSLAAAKRRADHNGIVQIVSSLCKKDLRTLDVNGVNFANGFLTEDLKLQPHAPEYGCTYTLPYRYMPELADHAQQWQTFLDRLWTGDEGPDFDIREKKLALQEAMAATMFGVGARYERVVLLFGLAQTGKSRTLRVMEALLPDEAKAAVSPDTWSDKFVPAQLANKLLNVAGELSEKRKIDGQKFKQIVSGDTISGQFKGQQIFDFRPVAMHWFASNVLPTTTDTTSGFNRRWLILAFNHPIKAEEKIANIENLLVADEREHIAAWAVQGITRLLRNSDYTLPQSHIDQINMTANNNNSVRYFLTTSPRVHIDPLAGQGDGEKTSPPISEVKLHDEYYSFCLKDGDVKPVTLAKFRTKMRELEKDLKFRVITTHTEHGVKEDAYANIILVEKKAA